MPRSFAHQDAVRQPATLTWVAQLGGLTCLVLAVIGFAGWWLQVPGLLRFLPDGPHLVANGVVLLGLSGMALLLMIPRDGRHAMGTGRYRVGQAAAWLVVALGLLMFAQYIGKRNFGIDELLWKDPFAAARGAVPGRLSFPAALNAILLGVGLGTLDARVRRVWLAQVVVVLSLLISLLAVIGYVCDVSEFYGQLDRQHGNGISVHEVVGFLILAIGALCARSERGLMAVVWSHTPGGLLARWLLLAPALGLFLTGISYVLMLRVLHVDHTVRTWTMGISNLLFVTGPIWFAVNTLHRIGLERDRAHHELEERVQERTIELTRTNAALQAEITERRAAEDALRKSEERYRIVADNTYAMEYWQDPSGCFVYVSPSSERITGYAPTEFAHYPDLLEQLVATEDKPVFHKTADHRASTTGIESAEFRLIRRDGSEAWVAHHSRPLFNDHGVYLGRRASLRDITQRRSVAVRLREERDFSRALVDSLPGAFYLFDEKGTLLRWNRNLERITGRPASEIARMHPTDFFSAADRPVVAERLREAFENGEGTMEVTFAGPRGSERTFVFTGVRIELGKGACLVGVGLDITDRKRAEKGVLDRDRELRLVMDSGPTLISYIDSECRYRRVNQGYAIRYGLPPDAVKGRHIRDVLGEVAWQVVEPYVSRALSGEVVSYEQELPLSGGTCWIQATYTPDRDSSGRVRGFVVHALDIGERKKAERELREARDRLESQAAELERCVAERTAQLRETIGDLEAFSYSVAHDLRSPLRGMQGFAALLLDEYSAHLPTDARAYLERIASSATRMDLLIQDALDYTRVLRAQTALSPLNLSQLIHHLVATYPHWQPPQAHIQLDGDFPHVLAHEGFLTQCVSNLVNNAIKFVPRGVVPHVRIWAEPAGENVRLWVEDNGIGIAPKDHDRIFQMFERLNPADQYEGTGIGLTIVKKAVERMGGSVGFQSQPGNGSKFWLELKNACSP